MMQAPKQKKRSSGERKFMRAMLARPAWLNIAENIAAKKRESLQRKKQEDLEMRRIRDAAWHFIQSQRRDPKGDSRGYEVQIGDFKICLWTPFNQAPASSEKHEYRLRISKPRCTCLVVTWTIWNDIRVLRNINAKKWRKKFMKLSERG